MKKLLLLLLIPLFLWGQNISSISLKDVSGKKYRVSNHLAKDANIVVFWATWCFPCKKEFKELESLLKKYENRDIRVIALSVDEPRTVAKVKMFARQHDYPFRYLVDPQGRAKDIFLVNEIPVTFIADEAGEIFFSQTGYRSGDVKEIERQLLNMWNHKNTVEE